ncbi:MAG: UbiD family decarboxylase [Pseudonocardiaceae bacterium]|nr:UbiD family decarboxylase [Pseudonocardiaceae bacterium]
MTGWPDRQDLRGWTALLDERGELGTVTTRISPERDVAAVLEHCDGNRAVWFTDVDDSPFPLVGNTVHHREHLALAVGCPVAETAERFGAVLGATRPCRTVAADDAPILAHRLAADEPLHALPLTLQHDEDAGRYITSGLVVAKDPESDRVNLSINRLLVAGGRELRALVLPGRLRRILDSAERREQALQVAIVIGVDPLLTMASQSPADATIDDFEVASALRAEPLPVVRPAHLPVPVPADAQILLECRFRPGERAPEGPFGEYPRTYGPGGPAPVLDVEAGWHRDDAVGQTILSGGREHFLVGGIPREARLLAALRRALPNVAAVRLTEGGSCRMHAVVGLRSPRQGDAVTASMATFRAVPLVKLVTVVDDDVDVFRDEEVEWAVATRMQADRDLLVVPNARGSSLDPSAGEDNSTAKMGIDATIPRGGAARHGRITVTPSDEAALRGYLAEAGAAP